MHSPPLGQHVAPCCISRPICPRHRTQPFAHGVARDITTIYLPGIMFFFNAGPIPSEVPPRLESKHTTFEQLPCGCGDCGGNNPTAGIWDKQTKTSLWNAAQQSFLCLNLNLWSPTSDLHPKAFVFAQAGTNEGLLSRLISEAESGRTKEDSHN